VLNKPQSESQEEERRRLREKYPTLAGYLDEIGAVTLNFGSHVVRDRDEDSRYWHDRVRIKVAKDGDVTVEPGYQLRDEVDPEEFEPSAEKREAIKKEVEAAPFPTPVPFSTDDLERSPPALVGADSSDLYLYPEPSGDLTLMVQWRKLNEEGKSRWLTYTLWSDKVWRMMEPEFLPLFGLDKLFGPARHEYGRLRIMIHEGAKAARRVYELLKRGDHPWHEDLKLYTHLGWAGGVHRVHEVDWKPIKKLNPDYRVTLACDHDVGGVNAASEISRILQRNLLALKFDDRFPETFDLADDWPTNHKDWWRGKRYRGPRLDEFLFPATWATKALKNAKDKKKPIFKITDLFAYEWLWVESQDAFVNRQQTNILRKRPAFNSRVRSFSDVEDTAALFDRSEAQKCDGLAYEPATSAVVINVGGERLVNLYRPSDVKPIEGDPGPFIKFMLHLIPNRSDRRFVLRWITTLVACPWVKMAVALLLASERQGVGKTTLGEILARLVGLHNASFPNEDAILKSGFTSWIRNKRLVVMNEIFPGRSRKMYDVLKDKVTDPHVDVNEKYLKPHTISNYAHFFALSNFLLALHLDDADSRWYVPTVTEELRDKKYWDGFYDWWLRGDGLGIILAFLLKRAENPANLIAAGERAPASAAKEAMITESMSEGERITLDFGEHVVKLEKIVLAVDDVRDWVAARLQISREDKKLPSALKIRRALVRAGLREPGLARGEVRHRYKIGGLRAKSYVVANFEIEPGSKWEDIRDHYKVPDSVVRM
jgi:hypothetical protein